MTVEFLKSRANGTVFAPPSKSFAHRELICGALTEQSNISNVTLNDDICATVNCLRSLGASVIINGNSIKIGGLKLQNIKDGTVLDCNESASTLRFLIPLCLSAGKRIIFKGSKRLMERPVDEYEKLCAQKGFLFEKKNERITVCGNLTAGDYTVNGNISSQFVTGMLTALSVMNGKSTLSFSANSRPYIMITVYVLKMFGVKADIFENTVIVFGKSHLENTDCTVEGDCSNAAYVKAFELLGGNIFINGINKNTVQGDILFDRFLFELKSGKKQFDLKGNPDLAPILFVCSAFTGGASFFGTERLKYKESDRILAMKEELQKFGIELKEENGCVTVNPQYMRCPDKEVSSHNDHRIVMALSLLCANIGGTLTDAQAVNKSYPEFFDVLIKLGIKLKAY